MSRTQTRLNAFPSEGWISGGPALGSTTAFGGINWDLVLSKPRCIPTPRAKPTHALQARPGTMGRAAVGFGCGFRGIGGERLKSTQRYEAKAGVRAGRECSTVFGTEECEEGRQHGTSRIRGKEQL
ncbi:hypothetical protein WMY93_018044 [Mugilogobius chulae]|uniref:Uncharacterized protein n=1 Tax=Mugilogobius chulae TaxID=88201 RepID=A0AAW0NT03_9GOBI